MTYIDVMLGTFCYCNLFVTNSWFCIQIIGASDVLIFFSQSDLKVFLLHFTDALASLISVLSLTYKFSVKT